MKSGISITLTEKQHDIISAEAAKHGRSISSEIGYMIENNRQNADTFKTIFEELAFLKKAVQERVQ